MRTPRGYASVDAVRPHRLSLLIWGGIAGYVVLTVLVATGVVDGLDHRVLHFCARHRQPTLVAAAHHIVSTFSPATDAACLGVGAGLLAWLRRRPAVFVAAATTAWLMAAIVLLTKAGVGRSFPTSVLHEHGGAYPSGHTAAFLVCFGTLAFLATTRRRRWRAPLFAAVGVATGLVAAALIYGRSHWLTDTIGSISLGVALLSALARAAGAGRPRRPPPRR